MIRRRPPAKDTWDWATTPPPNPSPPSTSTWMEISLTGGGGDEDSLYNMMNDDDGKVRYLSKSQSSKTVPCCCCCSTKIRCCAFTCCLIPLLIALLLVFVFFCIPSPIDPKSYKLPDPPVFEGPLTPNTMLQNADRLMENQIAGPESLLVLGEKILTGLKDGRIVQVLRRKIETEYRFGGVEKCGSYDGEPNCGRPLGIRMNDMGETFVADAYLGIIKFDLRNGSHQTLVQGGLMVDGRPLKFINDIEFYDDLILFTDSSSKFGRRDFMMPILEAGQDGRLLSFDTRTEEITVLMDGLSFPNGVQLAADRQSLLMAETTMARIHRYWLLGPKRGKSEIFVENLPGLPDNIRLASNGSLWVPMASVREAGRFNLQEYTTDKPWLRSLITKLVPARHIGRVKSLAVKPYGLVVLLSQTGKYVASLHDPTGRVIPTVSEVADTGGVLFLGSYGENYLGKLVKN